MNTSGVTAAPKQHSAALPYAALILTATIFGSTFIVVKNAVASAGPIPFLAVRFAVGVLVLLPIALYRQRPPFRELLRYGIPAGIALVCGYGFQTVGLQYTTGSVSAFITYTLVIVVAVLHAVRSRKIPPRFVTLGVVVAFTGLVLLSGVNASGVGFGKGEILSFLCAVSFAAHILVLDSVPRHVDSVWLAVVQLAAVSLFFFLPGFIDFSFSKGGYGFESKVWLAALYLGVVASAVAFFCQTWAQQYLEPTKTSLLLMLEPVSAGIVGYLIAHDKMTSRGIWGALLILLGIVSAELGGRAPKPTVNSNSQAAEMTL